MTYPADHYMEVGWHRYRARECLMALYGIELGPWSLPTHCEDVERDGEWCTIGYIEGVGRRALSALMEAGFIECRGPLPNGHSGAKQAWFRIKLPPVQYASPEANPCD